MDDSGATDEKRRGELQHVPAGTALSLHTTRSNLLARGRRDAASASTDPQYQQAAQDYSAGRFDAAATGFQRAAERGHAESQYVLSTMYDAGQGVGQDAAQAEYWERRAAQQGHAYAQANLSFRYYVVSNFAESFAWCQRAAYSHLAWAEYHLGLMYRKGEGVDQSDAEAAYWYRLAATQGFPEAEQKLAELYYLGLGVPVSHSQAAMWYRRAADHGNAEAQFQLSHLYATGRGVESDYVQSRYWIRQAASLGHEQARRELKKREYRDA